MFSNPDEIVRKLQMASKHEQNFLLGFAQLCSGTEIPEPFSIWSGLSAISACLGRRVYLDMGTYVVFPNLFSILVGSSGRVRKSTSISVTKRLLDLMDQPKPKLISQKITTEALINTLDQKEETDPYRIGGRKDSVGYVIADELITFLNRNAYEAGLGGVLIQTYDAVDNFAYTTMARGEQKLERTCLGLLGGSTIDWLVQAIPESAVGGGLTSRMVFVYVKEASPPVAITYFSEQKQQLQARLVQTLNRIQQISGPIAVHEEALKMYIKEYNEWSTKTGEPFFSNKSLSGYASRRFNHIWKVSMCLACGESDDRIILPSHFGAAVDLLVEAEKHMPTVLDLVTSSIQGNIMTEMVTLMKSRGSKGILRSEILRMFSNRINVREIDVLLETICQSGQAVHTVLGSHAFYQFRQT